MSTKMDNNKKVFLISLVIVIIIAVAVVLGVTLGGASKKNNQSDKTEINFNLTKVMKN